MPHERNLKKDVVARTFQFDCDRFLRLQVSTEEERERLQEDLRIPVPRLGESPRPGVQLVREEGRRWEIGRYEELLGMLGEEAVSYRRKPHPTPGINLREFEPVDALAELRAETPPLAIIEAAFEAPDFTPAIRRLRRAFGFGPVVGRPDILWITPTAQAERTKLIGPVADGVTHVIHVVDVKMAAEPALRHFVEVTFYTLALDAALRDAGLDSRYAVSAAGLIWPGTHDPLHFINLVRRKVREGASDPTAAALAETLIPVPYEVYRIHVRQFFEERLPAVLQLPILEAAWHVAPTCQLCEFLPLCRRQALDQGDLSRIAWLTRGQKELLIEQGIRTVSALAEAIRTNSEGWRRAADASHQLRSDGPALLARAQALDADDLHRLPSLSPALVRRIHSVGIDGALRLADSIRSGGLLWQRAVERIPSLAVRRDVLLREAEEAFRAQPAVVPDRNVALMPRYWEMGIFLTVHFDPGSGLTFALGAERVYFRPGVRRPEREEKLFIVPQGAGMAAEAERQRLIEFLDVIGQWLGEAHAHNEAHQGGPLRDKVRAHIFVWDGLELRQLRRMFERHMEAITGHLEILARLFPPEGELQDPDAYRSHPGTIVKEAVRLLVGLPVAHDYTLLDVANAFHPYMHPETQRRRRFRLPYGFWFPLTDQIPFERAYELWNNRPMLRRRKGGPMYTSDEIHQGIRTALSVRLRALEHVVGQLREHHGAQLVLRKAPFSARESATRRMRLPEGARRLNALHLLDNTCREFEVRGILGLPVDEREARFHAIRGLRRVDPARYAQEVRAAIASRERYRGRDMLVFTFAESSRDARIEEGDFTLILSNEGVVVDPDERWRDLMGLSFPEAVERVQEWGEREEFARGSANATMRSVLGVELARLAAVESPPHLILTPRRDALFALAVGEGLLDLDAPLVLDRVHEDHETEQIERILRTVGGRAAPAPRARLAQGTVAAPVPTD